MSIQISSSSARRLSGLAGLAALSLLAVNVQAGEQEAVHKTVRYADLNLDRSSDVARLYERLGNAAQAVCSRHDGRDLLARRIKRDCESEALSSAVAELNNPAVTALHSADARVRVAQRRTSGPSKT
jgi:UrcA family protein